jgi:hypothetical protein
MERKDRSDEKIDVELIGLIAGVGLAFASGDLAREHFIEGEHIVAGVELFATALALTGAGVGLRNVWRSNPNKE